MHPELPGIIVISSSVFCNFFSLFLAFFVFADRGIFFTFERGRGFAPHPPLTVSGWGVGLGVQGITQVRGISRIRACACIRLCADVALSQKSGHFWGCFCKVCEHQHGGGPCPGCALVGLRPSGRGRASRSEGGARRISSPSPPTSKLAIQTTSVYSLKLKGIVLLLVIGGVFDGGYRECLLRRDGPPQRPFNGVGLD